MLDNQKVSIPSGIWNRSMLEMQCASLSSKKASRKGRSYNYEPFITYTFWVTTALKPHKSQVRPRREILGWIRDGHIQVDGNAFGHVLGAVVGGGELPQGLTQQRWRAEAIHELLESRSACRLETGALFALFHHHFYPAW